MSRTILSSGMVFSSLASMDVRSVDAPYSHCLAVTSELLNLSFVVEQLIHQAHGMPRAGENFSTIFA